MAADAVGGIKPSNHIPENAPVLQRKVEFGV